MGRRPCRPPRSRAARRRRHERHAGAIMAKAGLAVQGLIESPTVASRSVAADDAQTALVRDALQAVS